MYNVRTAILLRQRRPDYHCSSRLYFYLNLFQNNYLSSNCLQHLIAGRECRCRVNGITPPQVTSWSGAPHHLHATWNQQKSNYTKYYFGQWVFKYHLSQLPLHWEVDGALSIWLLFQPFWPDVLFPFDTNKIFPELSLSRKWKWGIWCKDIER